MSGSGAERSVPRVGLDSTPNCRGGPAGTRRVWWEGEWRETAVYARLALPAGAEISGPAILEQDDATAFIDPGLAGIVDRLGNVIVGPEGG